MVNARACGAGPCCADRNELAAYLARMVIPREEISNGHFVRFGAGRENSSGVRSAPKVSDPILTPVGASVALLLVPL